MYLGMYACFFVALAFAICAFGMKKKKEAYSGGRYESPSAWTVHIPAQECRRGSRERSMGSEDTPFRPSLFIYMYFDVQ